MTGALAIPITCALVWCPECGDAKVKWDRYLPLRDREGNRVLMWLVRLECFRCLLRRPIRVLAPMPRQHPFPPGGAYWRMW